MLVLSKAKRERTPVLVNGDLELAGWPKSFGEIAPLADYGRAYTAEP
ncbi:hypothetical protein QQY24_01740 [Streptomyces sp. TG1A-8]|nr:hypothetical protein [Streptomyces sp. TG1A-8]MDO0924199.1 hypothetical protein [Streptomyces sp. TG1A-8]